MNVSPRQALAYAAVFIGGFGSCALIAQWAGIAPNGPSGAKTADARRSDVLSMLVSTGNKKSKIAPTAPLANSPVADATAKVAPAVVSIDVASAGEGNGGTGPFGYLRPGEADETDSAGSGIIFSSDGLVVTNNHVIDPVAGPGGGDIVIRTSDGTEYRDVSIVGRDAQTDLAVLQINAAKNLPAAPLGNSNNLRVGDWAIAVGNPLGFNATVTLGIVSAVNRRDFRPDLDALHDVIQTDAAINPGNSGGALADINGRVVGINTAIASSTGASVGIGFAIPINTAKSVMYQLVRNGKVVRPYLGVVYSPVAGMDRKSLPPGVSLPPDNKGAVLSSGASFNSSPVASSSPAEKAGLKKWDVIREIAGREVAGVGVIKETVQDHNVGDTVPLTVWRGGKTLHLTVKLAATPPEYARISRAPNLMGVPPYLVPSPRRRITP